MTIKKSATIVALLLSISLLGYSIFFKQMTYVQVAEENQNFRCQLRTDQFRLNWIHSVEKTPWSELYIKNEHGFILKETSFVSFGAGTPNTQKVIQQKNGKVTLEIDQFIPEIHWVVSSRMQGNISIGQVNWKINQQFPDYSVIYISVQKDTLWNKRGLNNCI